MSSARLAKAPVYWRPTKKKNGMVFVASLAKAIPPRAVNPWLPSSASRITA